MNIKKNNNINSFKVENFKSIAGKGLKGEINQKTYYVGKKKNFLIIMRI